MKQFSQNRGISFKDFKKNTAATAKDFDELPVNITQKPKVGVVGEIYIKYAALGNNHLEELLVDLGAEICVPGLMGFIYYCLYNFTFDYKLYKKGWLMAIVSFLDEKTEPLSYDVVWWKKLVRIVLGVVLAVALKEVIKLINVFNVIQISLLIDAIRYFIVVMMVGYLCPLLFKKIKL